MTFDGAVAEIERLFHSGHGGSVFTPNVDHIVTADGNPALRAAYAKVDLAIADGQWVVWASRFLGTPLPEKISGSDIVLPLARRGHSIYLVGGSPGVAEPAARRLEAEGARIAGWDSPQVDPEAPQDELIARIAGTRPDIVLVALGCPKQEIWIQRHGARLRPAVLLGVGGSLDFFAGRIRRAPRWISRSGLEWLYRLAHEPRRLARRYLVNDPKFLSLVLRTFRDPLVQRIR